MAKNEIERAYLWLLKNYPNRPKYENIPETYKKYVERETLTLKEEYREKISVVATGGKFEILHPGHIYLFEKAKKLGDLMIVVVAEDSVIRKVKNRDPIFNQAERIRMLNSLKSVDLAIPGVEDRILTVEAVQPDIIVYGYDQALLDISRAKLRKKPDIVRMNRLEQYSSSSILKRYL